jgi:HEAT repeat protein
MPLIPLLKRVFGREKAPPPSRPVDWQALKQRAVNGDADAIRQLVGFLSSPDWEIKIVARDVLAEVGPPALPQLLEALEDRSFDTSWGASRALAAMKAPDVLPSLLPLLSHSNALVREDAASILGSIGDPAAIPHLVPALRDDSYEVRREAATALRKLGWEPATTAERAVCAVARRGEELVLREDLGRFYAEVVPFDSDAIEPLANALRTSRDWRITKAAVEALFRIGDSSVIPTLLDVVDHYHLEYDTGNVRDAAALAAARLRLGGKSTFLAAGWKPLEQHFSPGPPLLAVKKKAELQPGQVIRIWHDILNTWATDWLEVLDLISELVVLRNIRDGGFKVRGVSDTVPCWRHPDVPLPPRP